MSMHTPEVSVLIPCFNTAPYLAATVESVLAQTYPASQIILIDDGSSDGTRVIIDQLAATHSQISVIAFPNNQGVVAARNAGLAIAQGEYIAMLDGDDLWTADALQVRVDAARLYPAADLIATDFSWFETAPAAEPQGRIGLGPRGRSLFASSFASGEPTFLPHPFDATATTHFVWTGATLIKRAALDAAGNFDPAFEGPEDTLLWLRLAQRGAFVFAPRITAHYRQRAGSLVTLLKGPKELHYLKVLYCLKADPLFASRRQTLAQLSAECHLIASIHYQRAAEASPALRHAARAAFSQPGSVKYWRNLISSGKQAVLGSSS